jgi:hypothetical protein
MTAHSPPPQRQLLPANRGPGSRGSGPIPTNPIEPPQSMGDDDASPTYAHPRPIAVKEVVFPITDSSDIKENRQKEDFGRSVAEGEDERQKGTGIIIATKENADPGEKMTRVLLQFTVTMVEVSCPNLIKMILSIIFCSNHQSHLNKEMTHTHYVSIEHTCSTEGAKLARTTSSLRRHRG